MGPDPEVKAYRALLRCPGLPSLLMAAVLARLSGRMFTLAIVLYALGRFHAPQTAGWLAFAALAPGLATSPLAGALLDRLGAPRAIACDMLVGGALVGAMALTRNPAPSLLLTLTAFYSLTSPLSAAGIRALLPGLVPLNALDRANAVDTAIHALTEVLGPAVAGLLLALSGARATFLVIAGCAVIAGACMRGLTVVPQPRRGSLLREAGVGVSIVLRHPTLRGLVASYALYQVSWGILLVAVPVMVIRDGSLVARADSVTGLIWAISGLAGGAGALAAGRLRVTGRERRLLGCCALGTALAIYPVAATAGLAGLTVGVTLVGLLSGPIDVSVLTLRQRRTPPRIFGRVLAVSMSLNMGGLPMGSALGGVLLTTGTSGALLAAALAAAASGVACWYLIPVRAHPER
jgi:MFS family permease